MCRLLTSVTRSVDAGAELQSGTIAVPHVSCDLVIIRREGFFWFCINMVNNYIT